jgi:Transmembrane domain of unknown function (DUF3566)
VASSKHGRGERPGAESDQAAGSPGVPNKDKSFLETLRDAKGDDDRGLTSAGRRLRDRRSRNSRQPPSAGQPVDVASEAAGRSNAGSAFDVFDHPVRREPPETDTLETPRVPGISTAPPRTAVATPGPMAPSRPTEERLRKAKRTRRRTSTPRTRPARGAVRRVRRTVKRVDPWSVLKLSLFYYSIFFFVWLIGTAMLFSFVESTGLFELIEDFGDGMEFEHLATFEITLGGVLKWATYIGAGLVLLGSVVNVVLAFLYNLGSDIVGGISVTFVERDE